jgi:MoxR-like ATPase
MPSDILGSEILDENRQFKFIKGLYFRISFLQTKSTEHLNTSGTFRAMQERAVTIAGENHKLDLPYFCFSNAGNRTRRNLSTLPEAQLDRFMFAIVGISFI